MKLTAIIEIPMGSLFKYERNKETGALKLDRPLNQPIPYSYGYVTGTLCPDGDPIDIFVLTDAPIYPLCEVDVEVFGILKCLDNGVSDDKLLATLVGSSDTYGQWGTAIIENYLETYKKGFEIIGGGSAEEALRIYEESVIRYKMSNIPKL